LSIANRPQTFLLGESQLGNGLHAAISAPDTLQDATSSSILKSSQSRQLHINTTSTYSSWNRS
jgi:hypothetical protein